METIQSDLIIVVLDSDGKYISTLSNMDNNILYPDVFIVPYAKGLTTDWRYTTEGWLTPPVINYTVPEGQSILRHG